MKTLVAYLSQTGNTQKVAQAIYEAIPGDKDIKELKQVHNLEGYDLVFCGFPILRFGPAPEAASFLEKMADGKEVALFVTHSASEDMPMVREWLEKCKGAAANARVKGVFNCQGELGEQIASYMANSGNADLAAWAQQRPSTIGQPDPVRLKRAQILAKGIIAVPG